MSALRISVIIPCYRNAALAITALNRLKVISSLRPGQDEIIVVDDGSGDDTALQIAASCGEFITLLTAESNQGRSSARNLGAQLASGDLLVFLDADCLPVSTDFFDQHRRQIVSDKVASIGPITGVGMGFWHRYQQQASLRRKQLFDAGARYAGSSQNLVVRRSAFEAVGGFDPAYVRYGFEDRDLLLRLAQLGSIGWAEGAIVQHMDALSLVGVSHKMVQAGGESGWRFHQQHPHAYRQLGYAALDCRIHPVLSLFVKFSGPCLPWLARQLDKHLESPRLPWLLKKSSVKLVSALSYAYGTTRALE